MRAAHCRLPEGACSVQKCDYFGKLVNGLCEKHNQYNWRHGVVEPIKHTAQPLDIDEKWAIWLAAVIDCEGWIGLFQRRKHGKATAYWACVGVGNTDARLPQRIRELTGIGNLYWSKRKPPAKDLLMWQVAKQTEVANILVTIRPHLLMKQQQADLILSMPPKNARANKERAHIKAQLTELNRKGIHP